MILLQITQNSPGIFHSPSSRTDINNKGRSVMGVLHQKFNTTMFWLNRMKTALKLLLLFRIQGTRTPAGQSLSVLNLTNIRRFIRGIFDPSNSRLQLNKHDFHSPRNGAEKRLPAIYLRATHFNDMQPQTVTESVHPEFALPQQARRATATSTTFVFINPTLATKTHLMMGRFVRSLLRPSIVISVTAGYR